MATKYLVKIDVGGGQDFTDFDSVTNAGGTGYLDGEWGAANFDAEVIIEAYDDGGDYTGEWIVWSTLNPTYLYPLTIKTHTGDSVTIDATGNAHGIYCTLGPQYLRIVGPLEIHSATSRNIYLRPAFADLEDIYSHDCAAVNDFLLWTASANIHAVDCRFEGTGALYGSAGPWHMERCSFSGGYPAFQLISAVSVNYLVTWTFDACKFDGSSLDANKPIFTVGNASYQPRFVFRNCIAYGGDYFLSGLSPINSLEAINNIFVNQATGVFNIPLFAHPEGRYKLEANCFWNCGNYLIDANGTYTTLGQLQAAGYDTLGASIDTDPDETAPFDGTIPNDSPCIMAGIGAGVLTGINGNAFAQINDYPSIGADAQWDVDTAPVAPTFAGIVDFVNNGDGSFTFSWVAGTGVNRYVLALHTSDPMGSFDNYVVGTAPDGETQRTVFLDVNDALLVSGTQYFGGVRAENSEGIQDTNTEVSDDVCTTTLRAPGPYVTDINPDPGYLNDGSPATIREGAAGGQEQVYLHLCNEDSVARTVSLYTYRVGDEARPWMKDIVIEAKGETGSYSLPDPGPITLNPGDLFQGETDGTNKVMGTPRVKRKRLE